MDFDVDVSRWVLELLLRDRDKASVAKRVLAVAPLSDHDWRLKKTFLLRTIESQILDDAVVTETVLESLESIEALDRISEMVARLPPVRLEREAEVHIGGGVQVEDAVEVGDVGERGGGADRRRCGGRGRRRGRRGWRERRRCRSAKVHR